MMQDKKMDAENHLKNRVNLKIRIRKIFFILIVAFICVVTINTAKAQTYDPYHVQVINNLIKNNGLQETLDAPETWTFAVWNDETPKQIVSLGLSSRVLTGVASFEGLSSLSYLHCDVNNITKLIMTNCIQLQRLICGYNELTELDITNCTQLGILYCHNNLLSKLLVKHCAGISSLHCSGNCLTELDLTGLNINTCYIGAQKVSLTLYKNEAGEYTLPISLNNPTFENSSISYIEGILKSTDSKVISTYFEVETNAGPLTYNNIMNGRMYFTYSDNAGIIPIDNPLLKIYPNPVRDTLFIEYLDLQQITVKLFDMLGNEVLVHTIIGKKAINISHLEKGSYIVSVFSKDRIIGNAKIIKQ